MYHTRNNDYLTYFRSARKHKTDQLEYLKPLYDEHKVYIEELKENIEIFGTE